MNLQNHPATNFFQPVPHLKNQNIEPKKMGKKTRSLKKNGKQKSKVFPPRKINENVVPPLLSCPAPAAAVGLPGRRSAGAPPASSSPPPAAGNLREMGEN